MSEPLNQGQENAVQHWRSRVESAIRAVSVSDACAQSVCNFLCEGIPPGSFVRAVLSNNLIAAVRCADKGNQALLSLFVNALMMELTGQCWGSEKIVDEWMAKGGLRGWYRAENEDAERCERAYEGALP